MFKEFEIDEIWQIKQHAVERSKVYRLLSLLYLKNPDREFLQKIKGDKFLENVSRICNYGEEEFKKPIFYIKTFIEDNKRTPEDDVLESLQIDFTRLTRGIKKGYGPPPPYESVWRGDDCSMGEWTEKALRFYAETKIGMDLEGELPDHIGIELKFMSLLCYRENEMWSKGDIEGAFNILKKERGFLREHLLGWAPLYLEKMEAEAESHFYKGVSLLTKNFLNYDKKAIDEILGGESQI